MRKILFFFTDKASNINDNTELIKEKKNKQPILLKDYERQRLLEKGHKAYLSDSDDDTPVDSEIEKLKVSQNGTTYVEEQEELKKNLVSAAHSNSDDDDDLLQIRHPKEKSNDSGGEKVEMISKTNTLNRYWKSDQLDHGEKFLRDYILKKQFIDSDASRIPAYNEIIGEIDDEEPSDEEGTREEFERKFNFRYEEPDAEFIKRYPRTINESVRRKDERRKEQRKLREERKEKEKEKKKDELKRLKNLQRKEIMEKIEKLKEITGNQKIGFLEEDMQDDFDMSKYDELMEKVFDDEYYNEEGMVDEEKPVFAEDDEGDEYEGYEDYEGYENYEEGNYMPHCEDPDFNMDADYVENKAKKNKASKKKGFNAKFSEAVDREKPLFDPKHQSFEDYFDEYYKLDFEDIIGDMPIRFKYRDVVPNDFGLTTDEILKAEDKELNEWCSLKKATQYLGDDEEKKLQQKFKKKSRSKNKKVQVFSSLREEIEKQQEIADNPNLEPLAESNTKQQPKKKSKLTSVDGKSKHIFKKKTLIPSWNSHSRRTIISSVNKSKIKNIRKNFKGLNDKLINKLSLERLAAYGLDERKKKKSS